MVYEALVAAEILPSSSNGHHTPAATNGYSSNGNGHHSSSNGSSHDGSNGHHQEQQEPADASAAVGSGPSWVPSDPTCPAWSATWSSICAVWASKWNHRAWLSRQSAGLPEEQLAVSVLIQQVSGVYMREACVCVRRVRGGST